MGSPPHTFSGHETFPFRYPWMKKGYDAVSEDGDVVVFEAADEYKELAKNSLGEMSLATPAADANSLYIRTATRLYKVKN